MIWERIQCFNKIDCIVNHKSNKKHKYQRFQKLYKLKITQEVKPIDYNQVCIFY